MPHHLARAYMKVNQRHLLLRYGNMRAYFLNTMTAAFDIMGRNSDNAESLILERNSKLCMRKHYRLSIFIIPRTYYTFRFIYCSTELLLSIHTLQNAVLRMLHIKQTIRHWYSQQKRRHVCLTTQLLLGSLSRSASKSCFECSVSTVLGYSSSSEPFPFSHLLMEPKEPILLHVYLFIFQTAMEMERPQITAGLDVHKHD